MPSSVAAPSQVHDNHYPPGMVVDEAKRVQGEVDKQAVALAESKEDSLRKAADSSDASALVFDAGAASSSSALKAAQGDAQKLMKSDQNKLGKVANADIKIEENKAENVAKADAKAVAQQQLSRLEENHPYQVEKARLQKQLTELKSILRRDIWVCDYVKPKMSRLNLILQALMVCLPVISTGIIHVCHDVIPEERGIGQGIAAVLATLHVGVVVMNHQLHLDRTLHDIAKFQKMSKTVLDILTFALQNKNDDMKLMFAEVHKKLGQMHEMSDFSPPQWAYKLYEEVERGGKIASHAKYDMD